MQTSKSQNKILFVGGHMTPALAVLEEFKSRGYHNFVWLGHKYPQTFSKLESSEFKVVTAQNIKFYNIHAGKLWRKWTKATLFKGLYNLCLIPVGVVEAFFILLRERPRVVVSFGGYIALPVVFAAWLLRIKAVTHEQTMTSGMANRILAKFANKIFVSWPNSKKFYPANKTILTGNPIRKEVFDITTNQFNFNNDLPIIYITGGNQGANTINWRLFEILPELLKTNNIIHQTGNSTLTNDFTKAQQKHASLPAQLKERYVFAANFYGPEIGEIFAKAQLVVSRAGANTVSEIIALDKYALFIPIPWSSGNEQQKNAEYAHSLGNGEILKQYDAMQPTELLLAIKHALNLARKRNRPSNTNTQQAASKIIVNESEALF
jgi:UDP-N-acetylglucosamine--N-acetylmuramyl-(pentapeptide) pyrophosphoryl-undecaprenol N-acetylglucosamine transferase